MIISGWWNRCWFGYSNKININRAEYFQAFGFSDLSARETQRFAEGLWLKKISKKKLRVKEEGVKKEGVKEEGFSKERATDNTKATYT